MLVAVNSTVSILIIDNDLWAAQTLSRRLMALDDGQWKIHVCQHSGSGCDCLLETIPTVIFVPYIRGNRKGSESVETLLQEAVDYPAVVLYSPVGSEQVALDALRSGAIDCVNLETLSEAGLDHLVRRALRKQQEMRGLIASESNYSELIEFSRDAMMIVQEGLIQFVNPAMLHLSGHSRDELIGVSSGSILLSHHRQRSDHWKSLIEGNLSGLPTSYEAEINHQDGGRIPVQVSAGLVDFRGLPAAFVTIRDLSETLQARLAIKSSEEKYEALFSQANDAIFLIREGLILDCNHCAQMLLGSSKKDIVGTGGEQFTPNQKGLALISGGLSELQSAKDRQNQERVLKTADGLLLEVEVSVNRVNLADGELLQVIVRDITERKRSMEKLQQSQERYDLVVQGAGDGVWDWDPIHHELYLSPKHREMLGLPESGVDMEVSELMELVHPGDKNTAEILLERRLGSENTFDVEFRVRHALGNYLWLRHRGLVQRNEEGVITRMVGSSRDVTNRREEEELRRRREAHFRDLARVTKFLSGSNPLKDLPTEIIGLLQEIFRADLVVLLRDYNQGTGEPVLQIASIDAHGEELNPECTKGIAEFVPMVLREAVVTLSRSDKAVRGLETWWQGTGAYSLLAVSIRSTVGPSWVLLLGQTSYARIWTDQQKELAQEVADRLGDALTSRTLWLELQEDIAKRELAEEELRKHRDHLQELVDEQVGDLRVAKEVAEKATEAMTGFLSNMSHELRTPLHGILSFASLGTEKISSGENMSLEVYFQRIGDSGKKLLALLNDLLDLSKMEAGKMMYDFAAIRLQDIVGAVLDEAQASVQAKGLRMEVQVQGEEQSLIATMDREKMSQVVRHLVSNAVKFSPANESICIEQKKNYLFYRHEGKTLRVPALTFSISNRGSAIPQDELESIFDKFSRGSTASHDVGGTGLGLAICREIIAAHRGVVGVVGVEGGTRNGAGFYFTIPVQSPLTLPQEYRLVPMEEVQQTA